MKNCRFEAMSNTILVDTREHDWQRHPLKRWFDAHGVKWIRSKLPVGDYARLDNLSTVIDRKAGMHEVYGNLIGQSHSRFVRECELAKGNGIRLIVLVQDDHIKTLEDVRKWKNPRIERWYMVEAAQRNGKMLHVRQPSKPPVSSEQLYRTMCTVSDRHGIEWRFCPSARYAETVCEILGVKHDG